MPTPFETSSPVEPIPSSRDDTAGTAEAPGLDPLLPICPSCRREAATVWVDFPADNTRIAVCVGCAPPAVIPQWVMAGE